MRINPDFACHANTRFSPANFTFEILNSNIEGFSITNENLNNETTNKIIGSYVKKDKILELKELLEQKVHESS